MYHPIDHSIPPFIHCIRSPDAEHGCRVSAIPPLPRSQVVVKINEFKPQELANVLWAFASLEFREPVMIEAATNLAARMAPYFKEQELSNIIWAMGRCEARHAS